MTANGHGNLPNEQRIANAPAKTGSDPKIAIGHAESSSSPKTVTDLAETPSESECDVTDSGQKTATSHAATTRRRATTETSPSDDALDCLIVSGKRRENDIAETGHGSNPTKSGLHDPSLFLNPKIGKYERIANRSGPRKTLPIHHVAERAVMSGERPPRKQREQGVSAANEQLPPSPPPQRSRKDRSALARIRRATRNTSTPLAGPRSSGRGGSLTGRSTRCIPRPPLLSLPS